MRLRRRYFASGGGGVTLQTQRGRGGPIYKRNTVTLTHVQVEVRKSVTSRTALDLTENLMRILRPTQHSWGINMLEPVCLLNQ